MIGEVGETMWLAGWTKVAYGHNPLYRHGVAQPEDGRRSGVRRGDRSPTRHEPGLCGMYRSDVDPDQVRR